MVEQTIALTSSNDALGVRQVETGIQSVPETHMGARSDPCTHGCLAPYAANLGSRDT